MALKFSAGPAQPGSGLGVNILAWTPGNVAFDVVPPSPWNPDPQTGAVQLNCMQHAMPTSPPATLVPLVDEVVVLGPDGKLYVLDHEFSGNGPFLLARPRVATK